MTDGPTRIDVARALLRIMEDQEQRFEAIAQSIESAGQEKRRASKNLALLAKRRASIFRDLKGTPRDGPN